MEAALKQFTKSLRGGTNTMLILGALVAEEGPVHGYQVMKMIKEYSEGEIDLKDASVYPVLKRYEKQGIVESQWGAGAKPHSPVRRYYEVTDVGRELFATFLNRWQSHHQVIVDVLTQFGLSEYEVKA